MEKNNFSLSISPGAANDIIETASWYNNKLNGLGERFLTRVKTSIDIIQNSPTAFYTINQKEISEEKLQVDFLTRFIIWLMNCI